MIQLPPRHNDGRFTLATNVFSQVSALSSEILHSLSVLLEEIPGEQCLYVENDDQHALLSTSLIISGLLLKEGRPLLSSSSNDAWTALDHRRRDMGLGIQPRDEAAIFEGTEQLRSRGKR